MLANKLLSDNLTPLLENLIEKDAISKMQNAKLFHLPVVDKNNKFIGLLAEEEIDTSSKKKLSEIKEKLTDTKIYIHQHIFEVFEQVFTQNLSCIPVVDENNKYHGLISYSDLMVYFGKISSLQQQGATIILSVLPQDYTLAKISQIVEENNAKILSVFSHYAEESNEIELILKLNTQEISSILQSFSRFEYTVKTYFKGIDILQEMYKERIDSLLNYLNT